MLWRHARSTAREFALFAFIVVTTACFEHVLDSTAPAIGGQPIARPAPFDAKVAFVSNRDGESYIYLAPEDGSAVHRFVRGEQPAWSPDGQRLAFLTRSGAASENVELRLINIDGSGLRILPTGGGSPSWSPDGTKIVFTTFGGGEGPGIYSMNTDGTGLTLLLSADFEDPGAGDWLGWPVWSPDGASIAFVRTNYGKPWRIYLMNADGSSPRTLTTLPADQEPSWSPDGSMLAFGSYQSIGSINADGTGYGLYPLAMAFEPDWSPDGRQLILSSFISTGPNADFGGMRIYVYDLESGAMRRFIPEAVAPVRASYRDEQAVWARR